MTIRKIWQEFFLPDSSVSKKVIVGADAHIGPFANITNLQEIAENRRGFLLGRCGHRPLRFKIESFFYSLKSGSKISCQIYKSIRGYRDVIERMNGRFSLCIQIPALVEH